MIKCATHLLLRKETSLLAGSKELLDKEVELLPLYNTTLSYSSNRVDFANLIACQVVINSEANE